jgi:hypothetical protein
MRKNGETNRNLVGGFTGQKGGINRFESERLHSLTEVGGKHGL